YATHCSPGAGHVGRRWLEGGTQDIRRASPGGEASRQGVPCRVHRGELPLRSGWLVFPAAPVNGCPYPGCLGVSPCAGRCTDCCRPTDRRQTTAPGAVRRGRQHCERGAAVTVSASPDVA